MKLFFLASVLFLFLLGCASRGSLVDVEVEKNPPIASKSVKKSYGPRAPGVTQGGLVKKDDKAKKDMNNNDFPRYLTDKELKCVDSWIKKNGLSHLGDKPGTMYPGGNPLFLEAGGVYISREEYLISHHLDELVKVCGVKPSLKEKVESNIRSRIQKKRGAR